MSRVVQDMRHAVRACLRAPLVSVLAVLAFALGIGVTATVFDIFYSVLLKPLPFPNADQLVSVYDTPLLNWKLEAVRIASTWLAGPPAEATSVSIASNADRIAASA